MIDFNKLLVLCSFFLSQTVMALVVTGKCGGVIIDVKISDISELDTSFELYYETNLNKKKLFYRPSSEHLSVACVQDKANHDLLLMEEMCGGSVCSDAGVYAVFDPTTKKMLVKYKLPPIPDFTDKDGQFDKVSEGVWFFEHEKKNHEEVAELLGYKPPYLPKNKATFCCKRSQYLNE